MFKTFSPAMTRHGFFFFNIFFYVLTQYGTNIETYQATYMLFYISLANLLLFLSCRVTSLLSEIHLPPNEIIYIHTHTKRVVHVHSGSTIFFLLFFLCLSHNQMQKIPPLHMLFCSLNLFILSKTKFL